MKYFLLRHLILILIILLIVVVRLPVVTLSLHFVATVLFEDLEATAETLALLAHEDPLIFECLCVDSFGVGLPALFAPTLNVLLVVHGHRRLPGEPQLTQVNCADNTKC